MTLGGDPDTIRDRARAMRTWALDVQTTQSAVAAGSGVQWVSASADRYRERLAEHAASISEAREEMIAAAAALDALADALQERQELIRRAMNAVTDAVDSARSTVGRLWGWAREELSEAENDARDHAQGVLARARALPPNGSPLWLDVGMVVVGDIKKAVT